jgi:hypothetical protein
MFLRLSLSAIVLAVMTPIAWGAVLFDENYTGSNFQPLTPTGVIDFGEGNFVYKSPANLLSLGSSSLWQFQTKVDGIIFDNGNIGFTFPGEITIEASAVQTVTGVNGSEFSLALGSAGPSSTNFFRMIYDPTPLLGDSNIPAGTGFANGTVILSGYFTQISHTANPTNTFTQPGTFLADVAITYADPLAFQNTAGFKLSLDGASWFPPQLPNSASILGTAVGPNDVRGSVDFSAQFVVIPEASTMLLVGIGLMTGGVVSLRRRRSA